MEKKKCSSCKKRKSVLLFRIKNKKTGARRSVCQPCQSEMVRNWHAKNRVSHNAQIKAAQEERMAWVQKLKEVPCLDCGNSFHFCAMDFDHRPGEKKNFELHKLKSFGLQKIKEEIAKCDVVCAVCHRIRTFKRTNGNPDCSRVPDSGR
jgi:hypothetical protein